MHVYIVARRVTANGCYACRINALCVYTLHAGRSENSGDEVALDDAEMSLNIWYM